MNWEKKNIFIWLIVGVVGVLFNSCVPNQSASGTRKSAGASTGVDASGDVPGTPTFTEKQNFYQNGSITSTNRIDLNSRLTSGFFLRGSEVSRFIEEGRETQPQCHIAVFPNSVDNQVLVTAALPKFFFNFTTNSREHYYLIEPQKESENKTFCQTPGVLAFLAANHSGKSITFKIEDLCTSSTCPFVNLSTSVVGIHNSISGSKLSEINTSSLAILVGTEANSTGQNNSCQSTAECKTKGFDCCSLGQCVVDKQVKSNIDQTSAEFLQSIQDISIDPSRIFNYPNIYHLCSSNIVPTPIPSPISDPTIEAAKRLELMRELFDCTNPVDGEMSLCTVTFTDVKEATTTVFSTLKDDRNFNTGYSGTQAISAHSIDRILYAGETMFENGVLLKSGVTIGAGNDNFSDVTNVTLTFTPAASAPHDDLKIRYKIDGSCERVSNTIARCYKIYVQGQDKGEVDDHGPASNIFKLPFYADTNNLITVEVDESPKLQNTHWELSAAKDSIDFLGADLQVFDTQVVKITYFTNLATFPAFVSKDAAQARINDMCECGNDDCTLREVKNDQDIVIDYICIYPNDNQPTIPLQQTVLVSSKSVPHLYYDNTGVYVKDPDSTSNLQEGNLFEYEGGNLLKPNNLNDHIGFNEIYGSFTTALASARPAVEVRVQKGKTYDIFVDTGNFSTCFFCGTDYYSNIAKMFPQTFLTKGAGYFPEFETSNPFKPKTFRSDDLLFGRACWIPATMIPWTHNPTSDRQQQRLRRLAAQHFMFANGYQRDWYGFDYGSVIGSFDGVQWFSIGNQRRIKADGTKLFVAINAYFGDQTIESTYTVVVSDAALIPSAGSNITTDLDSDGAECQKQHICDTDRDCIAQLGWEYTCESISGVTTKWPKFDANALEVPSDEQIINLISLFKVDQGSEKRCVYRGRGSMCSKNYEIQDSGASYTGTTKSRFHACSQANYCQRFLDGISQPKFNTKISRYGKSVKFQNASSVVEEDTADQFGKGIRILGRPLSFIGDQTIDSEVQSNLSHNQIDAICLPGRNPNDNRIKDTNSSLPTNDYLGDQVTGIGITMETNTESHYLSSCNILDSNNNLYFLDSANFNGNLSDVALVRLAGTQSFSTNLLTPLETLSSQDITKIFESEQITSPMYQENRCLKAPGAVCFTDLDCGSNELIADRAAGIDPANSTNHTTLNEYEIRFWQEPMICSQDKTPEDEDYELKNNKCCRETKKTLTIGTFIDQRSFSIPLAELPVFDPTNIASLGTLNANDKDRYSRIATVHDLMADPLNFPPLTTARADSCSGTAPGADCFAQATLFSQWRTFHNIADRTCCSGHWIRNFHQTDNGGGHRWDQFKHQSVPKSSLRCLNWSPCRDDLILPSCADSDNNILTPNTEFSCSHTQEPDDPDCLARSISSTEASEIFDHMGTLELAGIPQISIKSSDFSEIICEVDPNNASVSGTAFNIPIPGLTINNRTVAEYADGGNRRSYASDDSGTYNANLRRIFSPDQISCCLPLGTEVEEGADPDLCCSGFINDQSSRCQLPDFTNLSVYFNRFISSGAKGINESLINLETGFINSPSTVEQLACTVDACASGTIARGVSLSDLKVPGHEGNDKQVRRFIDSNSQADNFSGLADLYDEGLHWNDHIYCVPAETALPGTIICSQN